MLKANVLYFYVFNCNGVVSILVLFADTNCLYVLQPVTYFTLETYPHYKSIQFHTCIFILV